MARELRAAHGRWPSLRRLTRSWQTAMQLRAPRRRRTPRARLRSCERQSPCPRGHRRPPPQLARRPAASGRTVSLWERRTPMASSSCGAKTPPATRLVARTCWLLTPWGGCVCGSPTARPAERCMRAHASRTAEHAGAGQRPHLLLRRRRRSGRLRQQPVQSCMQRSKQRSPLAG